MTKRHRCLDHEQLRLELERTNFGSPADRRDAFALEVELLGVVRAEPGAATRRMSTAETLDFIAPVAAELDCAVEAPGDVDLGRAANCDIPSLSCAPGGQLRIRSSASGQPSIAYEQCARIHDALIARGKHASIAWVGIGSDPWHAADSVEPHPSITARCIDSAAPDPSDREHRRLSAAVRVFIGGGSPASLTRRLSASARWASALQVAFEFAPFRCGASSGTHSLREVNRRADRRRRPDDATWVPSVDGLLELALETRVSIVRTPERWYPLPFSMTFRQWMERGFEGHFPELADFVQHVDGLDLPVRPNGWIEIDVHDGQARPFFGVPLCLWAALLDDAPSLSKLLQPPPLDARAASRTAFAWAADALLRKPSGWVSNRMLAEFIEFGRRFVFRGRTPADDALEFFSARRGFELGDYEALVELWSSACGVDAPSSTPSR